MSAIDNVYGASPWTPSVRSVPGAEDAEAVAGVVSANPAIRSGERERVDFPRSRVGDRADADGRIGSEDDSSEALDSIMEEVNDRISLLNRSMRFRVNADTRDLQIQIIDNKRNQVIRSIPSEEMVRIAERMRDLAAKGVGAQVDASS